MLLLGHDDLERALNRLLEVMASSNQESAIYIVGGAAISLEYNHSRKSTTDVDVKITNPNIVLQAAEKVAQEMGLTEDWLDYKVNAYLSTQDKDSDWKLWKELGTARIYVIEPGLLLAMKLNASRLSRDVSDIRTLLGIVKPRGLADIDELYNRYFPGETWPDKAKDILNDWFQETYEFKPIA